ncbi:hypothetical protein V1280_002052 [Bradyrhizobium sp. AZCC 2230]
MTVLLQDLLCVQEGWRGWHHCHGLVIASAAKQSRIPPLGQLVARRMGRAKRNPSRFCWPGNMMGFASALPILRRPQTHLRILAAHLARALLGRLNPPLKEGAGKAGSRLAPIDRYAMSRLRYTAQRVTGQPEASRPSLRRGWNGLCRALPGERCTIAPVASRMTDTHVRLDTTHHRNTWRTDPGRQDHTILPYADHTGRARDVLAHGCPPCKILRADATCVHRRPARVRDDRDTPLFLGPE